MSKAQEFLESFNDFTKSDDVIRLRSNHRAGLRCLDCGRMLAKIHSFPAIRSCPNGECGTKYHFTRSGHNIGVRKL
jgi:hypothetical protein